jgi:hypothetical protein
MNIVVTIVRYIYFLVEISLFLFILRILYRISKDKSPASVAGMFLVYFVTMFIYYPILFIHLIFMIMKVLIFKHPIDIIDIIHIIYLGICGIIHTIIIVPSLLK